LNILSADNIKHRCTQRGGRGRVNIVHSQANFKNLVNKNAIKVKPEIRGPLPVNFS
jgi:hypothetical protein